ncbi:MAG: Rieske 2Fe-2S domain-containing protein [Chloroflexi bacterium]|nr:Rieske 2Fe-2S domain-containing protein [Chloroflexota bacterium]
MLSKEDNELITRVSRGTPMGDALRRYWIPALLSEELRGPDSDPLRVRLLGEDLVAFRDTNGQVGLIQNNCPHRGASLFFGRNEEAGIRCVYHGWKFDVTGQCVDMPNEPAESNFKNKVKATAYPCREVAGVIWTYMGPAHRQPPVPNYVWMRAPEGYRHISKTYEACNFVQAIEGGVDTSHSSFLHRSMDRPEQMVEYQRYRRVSTAPTLEVLNTDYGYTYAGLRPIDGGKENYVRAYQFIMPFQQLRSNSGGRAGRATMAGHLWVPIDDEHTWTYNYFCSRTLDGPTYTREQIDAAETGAGRGPGDLIPGTYRLIRNQANDWLIDRQAMREKRSYTGIERLNTQDFAVQESMGAIYDRSTEHLGSADLAVIAMRKLLLDAANAIKQGLDPLGWDNGSSANVRPAEGVLPAGAKWEKELEQELVAAW